MELEHSFYFWHLIKIFYIQLFLRLRMFSAQNVLQISLCSPCTMTQLLGVSVGEMTSRLQVA